MILQEHNMRYNNYLHRKEANNLFDVIANYYESNLN